MAKIYLGLLVVLLLHTGSESVLFKTKSSTSFYDKLQEIVDTHVLAFRSLASALHPSNFHSFINDPVSVASRAVEAAVPEGGLVPDSLVIGEEENSTMECFTGLGCFGLGKPWSSLLRPFPPPWTPCEILSSVTLYTRKKLEGAHQSFNATYNLNGMDFNPKRTRTVFMTHGFASNGDSAWLREMKDAYLKNEDANIFILDWGRGASLINYLQVASNTRIVGAQLAKYIQFLLNKGLKTKNIHLIGHSLGAHIMSYCAKNVAGISKINRITALDPAQPGFEGTPKKVRLDRSDAENIDVYHTDARPFLVFFGFGMLAPVGHVDFYFNGGSLQPGCLAVKTPNITSINDLYAYPVEVISQWVACSHGRAYEYFTAALQLKDCSFWGRKMTETENFVKISTLGRLSLADPLVDALNKCSNETCSIAGLDTFKLPARGSFAVTTKDEEPYCETTEEERLHLKNLLTLGLYNYLPHFKKVTNPLSLFSY